MPQSSDVRTPRKVVLRFPSLPSATGATGAVFHAPDALQALAEIARRLGRSPDELEAQAIDAHGARLAILVLHPDRPATLSRVGAFVLEGLSLLEIKLGLAYLRQAKIEQRA